MEITASKGRIHLKIPYGSCTVEVSYEDKKENTLTFLSNTPETLYINGGIDLEALKKSHGYDRKPPKFVAGQVVTPIKCPSYRMKVLASYEVYEGGKFKCHLYDVERTSTVNGEKRTLNYFEDGLAEYKPSPKFKIGDRVYTRAPMHPYEVVGRVAGVCYALGNYTYTVEHIGRFSPIFHGYDESLLKEAP